MKAIRIYCAGCVRCAGFVHPLLIILYFHNFFSRITQPTFSSLPQRFATNNDKLDAQQGSFDIITGKRMRKSQDFLLFCPKNGSQLIPNDWALFPHLITFHGSMPKKQKCKDSSFHLGARVYPKSISSFYIVLLYSLLLRGVSRGFSAFPFQRISATSESFTYAFH
jgi:hypothetical protein